MFTFLVTGLMVLAIPALFSVIADEGGTSGTKMGAEAGGSGEFNWNDLHGFVIWEADEKIEDEFNVTICENVKEDDKGINPSGHIFGELTGIIWDDDPEPKITISNQDFEDYRSPEDDNNLTVYALGEYYDADNPDENERERWAYKTVTIQKPNNPPTPVARVAEEGNWTWINLTLESDVTFIVSSGDDITLWFDASPSWDEDHELVTGWAWELNEDGKFGGAGETQENVSKVFSVGKSYKDLGLKVFDERGKESATSVDFTIRVKSPERKPDLTVGEIDYQNNNANKANYEVGDTIIVQPKIRNEGENDTTSGFMVLLEYSTDNGQTNSELVELEITDPIPSSNFELLTYNWVTTGFAEGQYKIRVTADINDAVDEDFEDNNQNTTNLISLEENVEDGDPILSIDSVVADKIEVYVNEPLNITVTVKNDGTGDGTYVDIYYYIAGEYQYYLPLDVVPWGENATKVFQFSGDAKGVYTLAFQAQDNGINVGEQVPITVTVIKENDDPGQVDDPSGGDGGSDTGFLPGFEVITLLGAVATGMVLYSFKRRP